MRYIMGWRDMYDLTFDERLVYWIRRLFLVLGGAATRHGASVPISCPPVFLLANAVLVCSKNPKLESMHALSASALRP